MASAGQPNQQPRLLSRARLTRRLDELEESGGPVLLQMKPPGTNFAGWDWLPRSARESPAGLALVEHFDHGQRHELAVAPPFVIPVASEDDDLSALRIHLSQPVTVGIVLLRLGYYAVGVARDETLVVTKTGSRYVRGGHRAGGQSANRFKRNREKWMREFFDEACDVARNRFAQSPSPIDWLALGGDRQILSRFLKRCPHLSDLAEQTTPWPVPVNRPGRTALDGAVRHIWSSRVYEAVTTPS